MWNREIIMHSIDNQMLDRADTESSRAEQIQGKQKYIQNRESKLPSSKNRMLSREDVVLSRAEYMNGKEKCMQRKEQIQA